MLKQLVKKVVHRQWGIFSEHTCPDVPKVYRNSFETQWTQLQEQNPCYSATYRNDEVTSEWLRVIIMHLVEFSSFELSKKRRGEEMGIPGGRSGFHT